MSSHSRDITPESEVASLSITTSPTTLIRIAREFQLNSSRAQAEARTLRRKLEDLSNQDSSSEDASRSKRLRPTNEVYDGMTDQENHVINAGRLFVILYCPWLRLGKATFNIKYNPNRNKLERFESDDDAAQGQVEEIMHVLGKEYSTCMFDEGWIGRAFIKGMKSQVSNTSTRLRRQCALLFDVSESDMLRPDVRKEKFRHLIGWVDSSMGGSYSSVDAAILHKDNSAKFNISQVFLNPILMRVFVALIRGPVTAKDLIHGAISNPKNETMASKHGIRQVTPGAIAGAAILTRWALSADIFLQPVGRNTGINYLGDFEEYLFILLEGLHYKKKSILNVFREWNKSVFPNSEPTYGDPGKGDGFKIALEMLEADEEEDEFTNSH